MYTKQSILISFSFFTQHLPGLHYGEKEFLLTLLDEQLAVLS